MAVAVEEIHHVHDDLFFSDAALLLVPDSHLVQETVDLIPRDAILEGIGNRLSHGLAAGRGRKD